MLTTDLTKCIIIVTYTNFWKNRVKLIRNFEIEYLFWNDLFFATMDNHNCFICDYSKICGYMS